MRAVALTAVAAALAATLSLAAPALAETAAPSKQDATPSAGNENEKGNQALQVTPSTGRTEQSATDAAGAQQAADGSQPEGGALKNGRLNVNGAPQDSQTVPAKFSERNDKLDHTPIMALPLGLSDEQRKKITDAVLASHAPVVEISAKPADELPFDVAMHDLPNTAGDPRLGQLKFVQTINSILLVRPSNRVVVAEIAK